MKNKIICVLVTLIAIAVMYIRLSDVMSHKSNVIVADNEIKYVDSDILVEQKKSTDSCNTFDEIGNEEVKNKDISKTSEDVDYNDEILEKIIPVQTVSSSVIETLQNEIVYGKMSGYGSDCAGCSGYVSYGKYIGGGDIYYNDSEYGTVRIVAGDKKYKFGTIVKINDGMLAIVLDRGGSIGVGKKFLFDLLYSSEVEANKYGVSNDVKFEILRNGF